jgi:hypothetical protein
LPELGRVAISTSLALKLIVFGDRVRGFPFALPRRRWALAPIFDFLVLGVPEHQKGTGGQMGHFKMSVDATRLRNDSRGYSIQNALGRLSVGRTNDEQSSMHRQAGHVPMACGEIWAPANPVRFRQPLLEKARRFNSPPH